MNLMETVGMMSTGALLTLGALHFFGSDTGPADYAPAPAAVQPAPQPQATRAASDLTSVAAPASTVDQLANIVAQSRQPLERTQTLTPMQLEAIAFFERSARQLNEANDASVGAALRFSNMAIDRLNVKYYYQFGQDFEGLDPGSVMDEQARLVQQNLCSTDSILTLMTDYGFRYSYTYTSRDHRLVGVVTADAGTCS